MSNASQLVVLGSGIQLGRHVPTRTLSEIRAADALLVLTDAPTLQWLTTMRPDLINLGQHYDAKRDRRDSYVAMEASISAALHQGLHVCVVLYGHPGVFAQIGHRAVQRARAEGIPAWMEPGISAEACLYADLGIDPGSRGVQSFEATQFLINHRVIDPSALLLLWQVALAGNLDCIGFQACPDRLRLLVEKLRRWYPESTEVILYEAAQLAIEDFRAQRMPLSRLPEAEYKEYSTLVIPPVQALVPDHDMLERLRA